MNSSLGELPRLFGHLAPVTRNLSDRRTRLGRLFRERSATTARTVAPVAATQADLFTRTAITFEALSADTDALKETISRSHPAFQAGIDSFPVQRPFLTDSAALAREMQPVARELRPTLPADQRRDRDGHPRHAPLGAASTATSSRPSCRCASWRATRTPASPCAG